MPVPASLSWICKTFSFRSRATANLSEVINNINQIIDHFEAYSLPVFHIISCYKADGSDWDRKNEGCR